MLQKKISLSVAFYSQMQKPGIASTKNEGLRLFFCKTALFQFI